MAIIVENGTGVADANSYVSEADLTAFATSRGITLTQDEDILLLIAMDYIESLNFKGLKVERNQALQWPRVDVYYDNYYADSNVIPNELKNALMQCAIAVDQGNDPAQDLVRSVKRQKVGSLEVEYMDGSITSVKNRRILNSIRKLLASGGNMSVVKG